MKAQQQKMDPKAMGYPLSFEEAVRACSADKTMGIVGSEFNEGTYLRCDEHGGNIKYCGIFRRLGDIFPGWTGPGVLGKFHLSLWYFDQGYKLTDKVTYEGKEYDINKNYMPKIDFPGFD